ncbi:sulfur carrier protein ThiS [Maridesulfovibrio bastinii]|jgi:sulfur carrier protein|uniref:sulfur carrier protein ThiS n=1 Tax=Maridesulfovibrio bastinii TaxID=47157 RepID=UPI0004279BE5|nr:sulfur carrier protein ThiS [Maridesulfovibrio bastinii]
MIITVNGEKIDMSDSISVKDMLVRKNIKEDTVVIELNYEILPKENFAITLLKDGDNLEVLRFVGGG